MSQWLDYMSEPSYNMAIYDQRPDQGYLSPLIDHPQTATFEPKPVPPMHMHKPKRPVGMDMLIRRPVQPQTAERELLGTSAGSMLTYDGKPIKDVVHKYLPPLTPQRDFDPYMAKKTKYQSGQAAVRTQGPGKFKKI